MLKDSELQIINKYLPNGALYLVLPYFEKYTIKLVITRERKTLLGTYSPSSYMLTKCHKITVNHSLNQYAFLITLIHEMAHLITFVTYKFSVAPHGKAWKQIFKNELIPFIENKFFPHDIELALLQSIHNLKASTCADLNLLKILSLYDKKDNENLDEVLIEDLKPHEFFYYQGRKFRLINKARTRYLCEDTHTKQQYKFLSLAKVTKHFEG